MRTFIFATLLFVASLVRADIQEVPAKQVSFPTNTYQIIQSISDSVLEALIDLDGYVGTNAATVAAVATNTANIASNAANIATNVTNISANTANIATNLTSIQNLNTTVTNIQETGIQAWRICTNDTTIVISNSMSVSDIHALGETYDWIAKNQTLTYLWEPGTYTFSETLNLNELLVPGEGYVIITGNYSTAASPEIVIDSSASTIMMIQNYFVGPGTAGRSFTPGYIAGFRIVGDGDAAGQSAFVLGGTGADFIIRAPFLIENVSTAYRVTRGGKLYLQPFETGGSAYPFQVIADTNNAVTTAVALYASGGSRIEFSQSNNSSGANVLGLVGTSSEFQYIIRCTDISTVNFGEMGYPASTPASYDALIGEFSQVIVASPGTRTFDTVVANSVTNSVLR